MGDLGAPSSTMVSLGVVYAGGGVAWWPLHFALSWQALSLSLSLSLSTWRVRSEWGLWRPTTHMGAGSLIATGVSKPV